YLNVIFVADSLNIVPESDNDNIALAYVQVPEQGAMDCSSAIVLQNGVWYFGNTQTDGTNNIESYFSANDMTGPEVIHTFIPQYNGFAKVTFSEKEPGLIQALILPICNENTYLSGVWFNSITDTLGVEYVYVSAGTQYYIVVDGLNGESGNYALKVDLPEECPEVTIEVSGKTNLCEGDYFPSMWTRWGANAYQWFMNGEAIPEATESWFQPNSAGAYHLCVTENGCSGFSEVVNIAMSMRPDTAQITNLGDLSFCNGGSVELSLANTVYFPINWALNGELIDGASETSYQATQTGTYTLVTTNNSCSISSENSIDVETKSLPTNIGDELSVPSDSTFFYYTFDEDNADLSGKNNYFYCNDFQPTNDRYGNFWQARHYSNNDVVAYVSNRHELPDEFTLSLWFKTSSNSGGVISGLVDSPWNATQMEAMLYMDNDGKIHFYMSNGGVPVELVSVNSYNNNQWHNVSIRYNGNMRMSINNGSEVLQNLNAIAKLNFIAYWVFAGPNLPDNVLNMPSSKYFNGAIDDILCVYENNSYIEKFNYLLPKLAVQLVADEANSCSDPMVQFEILNSQPGINYRVWDETNSQWYSDVVSGNIENITITGKYEIVGATDFKIYAINNENNCDLFLDTIINAIPKTQIIQQPVSQDLCIGGDHLLSVVAQGDMLRYQWKHGDDNLGEDSNELFIENVQAVNLGEYSVSVSGTCGDEVSAIATIDFSPVWAINTQPFNSSYCQGDETTQSFVLNKQNECFNANENITVAGGGQTFSAETGSWTTFIAGNSIKFLPGFIAQAGSYVNAYITTEGIFCDDIIMPQSTTVNSPVIEKSIENNDESVAINNSEFQEKQIKVYPNPNNGSFYVQLLNFEKETKISICNIMGKQVYQAIVFENTKSNINVPYLPAGLYYISANDSKTIKSTKMVVR
ncbi:MAG: T9SS type A sorting domain-containing protein, partial [Prolixibacteraceae bacterium]|nr:T9SS type A sorting domain-containing protein [Prolixibacteraceae bacterium]